MNFTGQGRDMDLSGLPAFGGAVGDQGLILPILRQHVPLKDHEAKYLGGFAEAKNYHVLPLEAE